MFQCAMMDVDHMATLPLVARHQTLRYLSSAVLAAVLGHLHPRDVDACLAASKRFHVLSERGKRRQRVARVTLVAGSVCFCARASADTLGRGCAVGSRALRDDLPHHVANIGHGVECLPSALVYASAAGDADLVRGLYARARKLWPVAAADCVVRCVRHESRCKDCCQFFNWVWDIPRRHTDTKQQVPLAHAHYLSSLSLPSTALEAALSGAHVSLALWIVGRGGAGLPHGVDRVALLSSERAASCAALAELYDVCHCAFVLAVFRLARIVMPDKVAEFVSLAQRLPAERAKVLVGRVFTHAMHAERAVPGSVAVLRRALDSLRHARLPTADLGQPPVHLAQQPVLSLSPLRPPVAGPQQPRQRQQPPVLSAVLPALAKDADMDAVARALDLPHPDAIKLLDAHFADARGIPCRVISRVLARTLAPSASAKMCSGYAAVLDSVLWRWDICDPCGHQLDALAANPDSAHAVLACCQTDSREFFAIAVGARVGELMRQGDAQILADYLAHGHDARAMLGLRVLGSASAWRAATLAALSGRAFVEAAKAGRRSIVATSIAAYAQFPWTTTYWPPGQVAAHSLSFPATSVAGALLAAARHGRTDIIKLLRIKGLLISHAVAPNPSRFETILSTHSVAVGRTSPITVIEKAIAEATANNHTHTALLLLALGVPTDTPPHYSVLRAAARFGSRELACAIIERYSRMSPLYLADAASLAASRGHISCAQLLLDAYCQLDRTTMSGSAIRHDANAHEDTTSVRTGRPSARPSFVLDAIAGGYVDGLDWIERFMFVDWDRVDVGVAMARALAHPHAATVAQWLDAKHPRIAVRLAVWVAVYCQSHTPHDVGRLLVALPRRLWTLRPQEVYTSLVRAAPLSLLRALDSRGIISVSSAHFVSAALGGTRVDVLDWLYSEWAVRADPVLVASALPVVTDACVSAAIAAGNTFTSRWLAARVKYASTSCGLAAADSQRH